MIPSVQLDEIAEVKLGRQRSPKHHEGKQMRPYVRAANIGWFGWKLDDVKSMNFTDAEMDTYRLEPGDLLLGEASGSATEVGKPALWQGEVEECAFQNTLIRVRPREADSRYLLHYFGYCASTGAFARAARGVGIYHLGRKALAEWQIPLPAIDEQRRIAMVLDSADALRARRRESLATLDTIIQAIFIDMFGAVKQTYALGEVAEFKYGTSEKSAQDGLPTLRIPNVVGGYVSYDDMKLVPVSSAEERRLALRDNDLLFVRSNGNPDYVGRCAEFSVEHAAEAGFEGPVVYASYLIRARLNEQLLAPFASAYLNGHLGRRQLRDRCKTSAGQYNLNTKGLGSVEIPAVSVAEQERFSTRVAEVRAHVRLLEESSDQLDSLFASLQQRAFRGEL